MEGQGDLNRGQTVKDLGFNRSNIEFLVLFFPLVNTRPMSATFPSFPCPPSVQPFCRSFGNQAHMTRFQSPPLPSRSQPSSSLARPHLLGPPSTHSPSTCFLEHRSDHVPALLHLIPRTSPHSLPRPSSPPLCSCPLPSPVSFIPPSHLLT